MLGDKYSSMNIQRRLLNKDITMEKIIEDCKILWIEKKYLGFYLEIIIDKFKENIQDLNGRITSKNLKPLDGILLNIKANIAVKDCELNCGSLTLKNFISPYTSTVVKRLIDGGCIPFSQTNMDEFGMGGAGRYSAMGSMKSSVEEHLNLSPGGSSGGSAIATAIAPYGVLSLGSDTGGSVCEPSARVGIYGLKPTYGRFSRYGLVEFASSLDTLGLMSNSLDIIEKAIIIISGIDINDMTSTVGESKMVKSKKICIINETMKDVQKDKIDGFNDGIETFKKMGYTVEYIDIDIQYTPHMYYMLSMIEAASNMNRYDGIRYGNSVSHTENIDELFEKNIQFLGEEVLRRVSLGKVFSGMDEISSKNGLYNIALKMRSKLLKDFTALFELYEFIVFPPILSDIKMDEAQQFTLEEYRKDRNAAMVNLIGSPSLTLPVKIINNIPISISILGAPFSELDLVDIGRRFENDKATK